MLRTAKKGLGGKVNAVFTLCYAELHGLRLSLSTVKGDIGTDSLDARCEVIVRVDVTSFSYFIEDKKYFIDARGVKVSDGQSTSICFMTKNQADITMKSSEMDFLNWYLVLFS